MAANEIHVGDIGTIFEITLMDDVAIVDVSTATLAGEKQFQFIKPDGSAPAAVDASFTTDGTD